MNRFARLACAQALLLCCLIQAAAVAQTPGSPAARPRLTPEQWREDLQFAVDTFLARDRSFSPEARQRFRGRVAELQRNAERLSDEQIIVGLAKAVALARNAHTRLYILRNRTELRRYPVRVWQFSDGLYVVRATDEYADLLGAKVLRIAGRDLARLRKEVDPLFAGNGPWLDYMSAYTLTSPDVLIGLGLVGADGRAEIEFRSREGRKGQRVLEPLPLRRSDQPTESWWDLWPTRPRDDGAWVSALKVDAAGLPLYLRDTERGYWSEYLRRERLYYIQFNRAGNAPKGESVADFARRALEELRSSGARKVAVDLRFNTGGNLDIGSPFMKQLAAFAVERKLKLYVITGRATFSAGLTHAMQLREYGRAVLVGEPVGEHLDFWSEGGNLVAPNSKLTLHYADRFHSYSPVERPDLKPYLVTSADLSVTKETPDIPARLSSRDYFAARDPVLEAIKREP